MPKIQTSINAKPTPAETPDSKGLVRKTLTASELVGDNSNFYVFCQTCVRAEKDNEEVDSQDKSQLIKNGDMKQGAFAKFCSNFQKKINVENTQEKKCEQTIFVSWDY
ncbi:uncharacterized protein LOC110836671 [Zootermopsis nevadensis]|uniref:uncharacterized protein LOC110836671 n=1 Tax=Zootermopsis nevadensis TaxID=136037 RepID=UPI000B8E8C4F|nr:uncharacterized protein LOC110836671 [Zootermopsis nevadensis]XP_021933791.1 uncharacterized protein LOC110836671 [Zootermopsis nevadensis]XP_021933792.1 uncharacterized protein LOC110836671 [Zootermopsis nevadensis]